MRVSELVTGTVRFVDQLACPPRDRLIAEKCFFTSKWRPSCAGLTERTRTAALFPCAATPSGVRQHRGLHRWQNPKGSRCDEDQIHNEAIVDAYGPEEQALGWYYYLEGKLQFPFQAKCIASKVMSPLRKGETVEVRRMAPEKACSTDMLVLIRWQSSSLAVPLSQLTAIGADQSTVSLRRRSRGGFTPVLLLFVNFSAVPRLLSYSFRISQ